MKLSKLLFILTAVPFAVLSMAQTAQATTVPQFPSCLAPQGTLKVQYESGNHGIAGDTQTYSGKDAVYTISDNNLMQCLCRDNGAGTQTNWLKASNFSDSEIANLKVDGWIYIPNGSAWGLENVPYLAKNENYTCKGSTAVGGASATNNSSSSSNASSGVLGLASTGNSHFVFGVFALSVIFFTLGIAFNRKK